MSSMLTREQIVAAATDQASMAFRRELAQLMVTAFGEVGTILRVEGHLIGDGRVSGSSPFGNGDDRKVSAGYLCNLTGSLQAGVLVLVDEDNAYAAAALVRQMVEAEYLLWAFVSNHDDAALWLNSTREERLKMWQPAHLRKRAKGHFRDMDYWRHCNFGGHPTPDGVQLLLDPPDGGMAKELVLYESIHHASGAWATVVDGWQPDRGEEVMDLIVKWRGVERLREVNIEES